MPELPEVETIKSDLSLQLAGRRLTEVILNTPERVNKPSPGEFRQRLPGQVIKEVARRGKYLLLRLASGETLFFHLRMTGVLLLKGSAASRGPYTRAVFRLDGGGELHFCDKRKLGIMGLVKDEGGILGKLGPEPLSREFTPALLQRLLSQRSAPIKAVLCDQTVIAGIGNMYADEALFAAGLHPLRKARELVPEEVQRLHLSLQQVLRQGISNRGASIRDYVAPDNRPGTQHLLFKVAHRRGELCVRCGTPIERISIRGRGSYFCPRCQVL